MWNEKRKMRDSKLEMWNENWQTRNENYEMRNSTCEIRNAKCAIRNEKWEEMRYTTWEMGNGKLEMEMQNSQWKTRHGKK